MSVTVLRASNYRCMRWKNGGGITTEIAREPADGDEFDWRISIAEIAQDGDFSVFPGLDRTLMLLDGGGVELEFGDDAPVQLTQRYARHVFPGEAPVSCHLLDGPTRDFNLMLRRGVVAGELLARPIVGPMVFFAEPAVTWLVHVISGGVQVKGDSAPGEIAAGDTLLLTNTAESGHHTILTGHGELVLARLQRTS